MARAALKPLQGESTVALLLFGLVTAGLYYGYYIKRQSKHLVTLPNSVVSPLLVGVLFDLAHINIALDLIYIFTESMRTELFMTGSNLLSVINLALIIWWGEQARQTVNNTLGMNEQHPNRLKMLWTILASPLHFNYKVNEL